MHHFLRQSLNLFLVFSLTHASFTWAAAPAQSLKDMAEKLNAYKDIKSAGNEISESSSYGKEVRAYIQKHSLESEKLPHLKIDRDIITLPDHPEVKLEFNLGNGIMNVYYKNKKIQLTPSTSFTVMSTQVETLLQAPKSVFMSLFIEDAQAMGQLVLVGALVALIGLLYTDFLDHKEKDLISSAISIRNKCYELRDARVQNNPDEIKQANEDFKHMFNKLCEFTPDYAFETCSILKEAKRCFAGLTPVNAVNSTSRGTIKDRPASGKDNKKLDQSGAKKE